MKTLIIYTSQTGFTKKYAQWIAQRADAELLEQKEAQKKDSEFFGSYDAIVYGGWEMAGTVFNSKWFFDKAAEWKNKRLAIFCVGGSPNDNPDVEVMLDRIIKDDQKQYISAFYCQGGFCYEKMNTASRLAMKMFVRSLKNKKNASEDEKKMVEMISSSYDISDISYTDPIVEYLQGRV